MNTKTGHTGLGKVVPYFLLSRDGEYKNLSECYRENGNDGSLLGHDYSQPWAPPRSRLAAREAKQYFDGELCGQIVEFDR